jgi:hypothetical protein
VIRAITTDIFNCFIAVPRLTSYPEFLLPTTLTAGAFVEWITPGNAAATNFKLFKIKVFKIRHAIDDLFELIRVTKWAS